MQRSRNFKALHQRLNEVKQMDDKRTALTSPNWNLDLSKEVGKGYVAYVAVKEEDMLGGTPLSECQPYMAKAPSELPVESHACRWTASSRPIRTLLS